MASGYIAGGAIAGILYALIAAVPFMESINGKIDKLAEHNPFISNPSADLLSCIPFIILCTLLMLVGREMLLAPKRKA
jgi:hypothetical protein